VETGFGDRPDDRRLVVPTPLNNNDRILSGACLANFFDRERFGILATALARSHDTASSWVWLAIFRERA